MHYSVLVIGENIKKQLAPFQENNFGDCPPEYLKFVEMEAKYFEEYKSGISEIVVMPDGRLLSVVADEFQVHGPSGRTFIVPDHLERRTVPNSTCWPTFESFMEFWHKGERDPVNGKYGYWENPNAKWDYWQICSEDNCWPPFPLKTGDYAFQVYKRDIDFEKIQHYFESPATVIISGQWYDSFIDGKWCDCGFSSWWNNPSAQAAAREWDTKLIELVNSLDDNTLLTLVDCHI